MSQYTEIVAAIVEWTNRPTMVAEMKSAIRGAVNKAHRAGNFPRDLVRTGPITVPIETVQQIDYTAAPFVNFKKLAVVKPYGVDFEYTVKTALDLFDEDGFPRINIAYVMGNVINVKSGVSADTMEVWYYQRPELTNVETMNDWIANDHRDLIVLWAAATILAMVGEQEIKTRVETLAKIAYADLIADSIEGETT